MQKYLLLPLALLLLFLPQATKAMEAAKATLINNQGEAIGSVEIVQGTEGVLINIKAKNLPPGRHGMHFHAVGDCSDHEHFKKAKGHIMPTGKPHGYLHPEGPHEGNLPNLIVHEDGTADVELYSSLVQIYGREGDPALIDADGSTLIIHANPDDHFSQPIGGSGPRIACGIIEEKQ